MIASGTLLVKGSECLDSNNERVDHKEIPAEIMIDMAGKFDLDPNLYQALCFSCNRRKAVQDRDQIDRYFRDKAKLASGVTPGGGVETFTPLLTPAWSGLRYIDEKNFRGSSL